jgi:alkanesulfonate monooxygenase SsuD/methylene tetrahydromethanopterin reductase-like flavin-dependent oxidoreductase (luciferase family)
MEIGIGLPTTIPGVERGDVLDWARRAEARGFSTLGVIDRIIYPNWDPLVSLAVAAAVTEEIRLATAILISPMRNTALLAKATATIDEVSGGRLVLGLAVGARPDDFEVVGVPMRGRGRRFERQIEELQRYWRGEKVGYAGGIGPSPVQEDGPTLVLGGASPPAIDRSARLGEGWISGGGSPDQFADAAQAVRDAWERAGRPGRPRLMTLTYFALGPEAEHDAQAYLGDYYEFLGPETAGAIAGSAATTADEIWQRMDAFQQAGCDEVIAMPCSTDPDEVDRLADACGLERRAAAASEG